MQLFVELFTLAATLAVAWHAVATRGRSGALLVGSLLWLGFTRETLVAAREVLYGFAPLSVMLGLAPAIAAVIWFYSIYGAVVFAEAVTGERFPTRSGSGRRSLSLRFGGAVLLVMAALAAFYEPVLARLEMARWEPGTWTVLEVPVIALVGYTTMAAGFLLVWELVRRRIERPGVRVVVLALALPVLAGLHAFGLVWFKGWLGW